MAPQPQPRLPLIPTWRRETETEKRVEERANTREKKNTKPAESFSRDELCLKEANLNSDEPVPDLVAKLNDKSSMVNKKLFFV